MMRRRQAQQIIFLAALLLFSPLLAPRPAAAQSNEDDPPGLVDAIRSLIQGSDTDGLERIFADQATTRRVLEEESVRTAVRAIAVGVALVDLLFDTGDAQHGEAPALPARPDHCGVANGVLLPCWDDYLGDGEGVESLPYYPYAKRPNGCSIPGAGPGDNDAISLFNIAISFTAVCNNHDRCYYTLGTRGRDCNEAFRAALRARCEQEVADHVKDGWDMVTLGTSAATALETCYTKAEAMAVGVIGGQAFYHARAQSMQRDYLKRVAAYVEQVRTEPMWYGADPFAPR